VFLTTFPLPADEHALRLRPPREGVGEDGFVGVFNLATKTPSGYAGRDDERRCDIQLTETIVEKPPTLEYQALPPAATKTRRLAAGFAQFSGFLNFFGGMGLFAFFFSLSPGDPYPDSLRIGLTLIVACAVACIICGTTYLIGGFIIHRPHKSWESALMKCIVAHSVCVLLMTSWWALLYRDFDRGSPFWIWGLALLFHPIPLSALLFELLRRTRRGD
jgi:hypothetical protein